MKIVLRGLLLLALLCRPMLAQAHHSTANFDTTKEVAISGTAIYFSFTNPHSFIDVKVPDGKGDVEQYKVFATSKVVLLRYGWKQGSVNPGDVISVVGHPDRQDPKFIYLKKIVFANGKEWRRDSIDN